MRSVPMAAYSPVEVMTIRSVCGTQIPESTCKRSTGIRMMSKALRSVTMAAQSLAGVGTIPSVYGTQIRENTCKRSKGKRAMSIALRSVTMAAQSLAGVGTIPSVYGTQIRENTCKRSKGIRAMSIALRSVPMAAHSLAGVGTKPSVCGTPIPGDHLQTLEGHLNYVNSVAFSPDGSTLASGSTDGTVLLWEVASSIPTGVEPLARRLTTLGTVKRTALLQNYPNPFNPETWMPYQLANDAYVTLNIYDQSGHIVRTLNIGSQTSGVYQDRASAAYWDGRNQNGEHVTSGTYYYKLLAGDYTASRRMVIVK